MLSILSALALTTEYKARSLKPGEFMQVAAPEGWTPRDLQLRVRSLMRQNESGHKYTTSVVGNDLWIKAKPRTRAQKLEELLKLALLHIDDENLYDRIYAELWPEEAS